MANAHMCTRCKGEGILPVRIRKYRKQYIVEEYQPYRACPDCQGEGVVNEI